MGEDGNYSFRLTPSVHEGGEISQKEGKKEAWLHKEIFRFFLWLSQFAVSCFRFAVVIGWTSSCLLVVVALCCGVSFSRGVGCWCLLYVFRPVSSANKSDIFFLINK